MEIACTQLQDELHNLSRIFKFYKISFTSIYRRIRKLIPKIINDSNGYTNSNASSGFKITLRGDYLGIRTISRKGRIKLHSDININNLEIINNSFTDKHVNPAREGIGIINMVNNMIGKLFGHKGYDSRYI